jgi:ribosomal protein S18 acetylase RimI-like enzyme
VEAPQSAPADPLTFRFAGRDDIPALVALVESAYRGESSRAGWTTEADLLDGQRTDPAGVAEVLAGERSRMIVAEAGGDGDRAIVACCQLEHRGTHAYFGMFAVRPTLQGGGVGRAVLAEAERTAREEWGVTEMRMTVIDARDELIAWYERRGYRRTGELSPFPYGQPRFGVPRRAGLAFELLVKPLG